MKGCAKGRTPYIAYHDQADTDVVSSGLLLGLSCAGEFEIETGHFTNTSFAGEARKKGLSVLRQNCKGGSVKLILLRATL